MRTSRSCRPTVPIEVLFANFKTLYRKAGRRTVEEAWREVGRLPDEVRPAERPADLRHAGYDAGTA